MNTLLFFENLIISLEDIVYVKRNGEGSIIYLRDGKGIHPISTQIRFENLCNYISAISSVKE